MPKRIRPITELERGVSIPQSPQMPLNYRQAPVTAMQGATVPVQVPILLTSSWGGGKHATLLAVRPLEERLRRAREQKWPEDSTKAIGTKEAEREQEAASPTSSTDPNSHGCKGPHTRIIRYDRSELMLRGDVVADEDVL